MKLRFRFLHSNKHWVTVLLGWSMVVVVVVHTTCVLLQILERFRKLFKCYIQLKKVTYLVTRTVRHYQKDTLLLIRVPYLYNEIANFVLPFLYLSPSFSRTPTRKWAQVHLILTCHLNETQIYIMKPTKICVTAFASLEPSLGYYHHFCSIPSRKYTYLART